MQMHQGIGLRGDELAIRCGFDGSEPKEIRRRKLGAGQCRLAIAINTYHADVAGAYYFNRALLGILQDCLHDIGLAVAIKDVFAPEAGVLPTEERCSLELNEEYVLVDSLCAQQGRLLLWRIDYHPTRGSFGESDIVCDMFLREDLASGFRNLLTQRCEQAGVPLSESADS